MAQKRRKPAPIEIIEKENNVIIIEKIIIKNNDIS